MKIKSWKFVIIIAAICTISSAFYITKTLKDVAAIKRDIVKSLLIDCYYTAETYDSKYYPDTTIIFRTFQEENQKCVLTRQSLYGIPAAYTFATAVDPLNSHYSNDFNNSFTGIFGKPIHSSPVLMYDKDDEGKPYKFIQYSPTGVLTAFNKLYIKPTDDFEGYAMKKLYNIACKEYVRDFTKLMAYLMNQKALFTQLGNDYLIKAKTVPQFHPYDVCGGYLEKLFPTEKSKTQFAAFEPSISTATIGSLMRRQCDRTLPIVLSCLKKVLQDYDTEALTLINGKF